MKKIFIYTALLFITLFSVFWWKVYAQKWCCSHHWWVCWNSCCDWSALSAKCWWWSSHNYYNPKQYKCPSHSSSDWNWSCTCDLWYKPNSSYKSCIKDMDYQCSSKYYWTIYRAYDQMCICPWDKWKSTWGKGKLFC